MNNAISLIGSFLAGVALGVIFFGGLWWTLRRGLHSTRFSLWLFASLLLRASIVLTGFYFVTGGIWQRLAMCMVGFVGVRLVFVRSLRVPGEVQPGSTREAGHAS